MCFSPSDPLVLPHLCASRKYACILLLKLSVSLLSQHMLGIHEGTYISTWPFLSRA